MSSVQHGSVLTGEQMIFAGPIVLNESVRADGTPNWSVEFVSAGSTIETDGELVLNLADGRTGQMFVERNVQTGDGKTTVICRGAQPLT